MIRRKVVLVIDDSEDNCRWAQQACLQRKPVLTVPVEDGWETIFRMAEHLYAVLINIDDYQRGLALAILAVEAGSYHVGIISESTPDILENSFSINGSIVVLRKGDAFLLSNRRRDWAGLLESLCLQGPLRRR